MQGVVWTWVLTVHGLSKTPWNARGCKAQLCVCPRKASSNVCKKNAQSPVQERSMPTTKLIGILLLGQLMFLVILYWIIYPSTHQNECCLFKRLSEGEGNKTGETIKNALSLCCASRQGTESICSNVISKQAIARSKNCNDDQTWPEQSTQGNGFQSLQSSSRALC